MTNTRTFRKINTTETSMITTTFNAVSLELSPILEDIKNLLYILINNSTTQKDYPSIYLITDEQQKLFNENNIINRIYAAGLYFGFLKKGIFYFSIEGVEYLYKNGIFTDFKQLHLTKGGEKAFLYGNNILKKMVRKSPTNLKEKDFLLILNEINEFVGLGISRVNNETISKVKPNDVYAINISDKGLYLRRKQ
jgi:ribosome biogenesis protein Nip4